MAARIGGIALHVYGDSRRIAARARDGLDEKFRREALAIHPDLSGGALDRQVELVKRLYYTRLAHASAKARSRRRKR